MFVANNWKFSFIQYVKLSAMATLTTFVVLYCIFIAVTFFPNCTSKDALENLKFSLFWGLFGVFCWFPILFLINLPISCLVLKFTRQKQYSFSKNIVLTNRIS